MAVVERQMELQSHDHMLENSAEPTATPSVDLDGLGDFISPSPMPSETMEEAMITPTVFPKNDRGRGSGFEEEVPVLYPSLEEEEGIHDLHINTPMPSPEESLSGEMYASPIPSSMPPGTGETPEPSSLFNNDAGFISKKTKSKGTGFRLRVHATSKNRITSFSANFENARFATKQTLNGRTGDFTKGEYARNPKKSASLRGPIMKQSKKEHIAKDLGPQPCFKWLDNGTKKVHEIIWKAGPALLP